MKRLIIVGSPRAKGRSAHLAEMLFEANIDEHPEDELFLVPVSEVEIGPCIGCDACRVKSGVIVKDGDGNEVTLQKHRCVFDDDMQMLYDVLDEVDEVTIVSPVYFSGAPAPLKCALDRLQPYFWARVEWRESGEPLLRKRPLTLHVLGEGGDPHGYDALVSEVGSSFAVAGFRLERVLDWVGKVDESGEITAEATERTLADAKDSGNLAPAPGVSPDAAGVEDGAADSASAEGAGEDEPRQKRVKPRPKLDLRSGVRDAPEAARGKKPSGDSKAESRAEPKKSGGKAGRSQTRPNGKRQAPNGSAAGTKKQGKRRGR